ncbi:MAG: NYN domain-containing protein [Crocosphaera sp.]|nr:NYN domain-containing protein [Crocosphaera sp.]
MAKNKATISCYVDIQNVCSFPQYANDFVSFAKSQGDLIIQKVYYNSNCKNQVNIVKKLKSLGYHCKDVPCPLKNSADNQLISDLIEDIEGNESPDKIILVSGDGDFQSIVSILKKLKKYVIVVAQYGNLKQELKDSANEFYFLEKLPQLEKLKNQTETTSFSTKFDWDDAVKCLLDCIKTVENKSATLSYLGRMIRQSHLFPKGCKKFPCICKSDGRNFSTLKSFVKAVSQEGLVVMKDEKIFIPEA